MAKKSLKNILPLLAVFLFSPFQVKAASLWDKMENCRTAGYCQLSDLMQLAVNIAAWILGVVGSVALLFFVYGGFVFIFSGGSSEKVEQGKKIILGSVLGLVIVFASFLIIQFSLRAMGVEGKWYQGKIGQ